MLITCCQLRVVVIVIIGRCEVVIICWKLSLSSICACHLWVGIDVCGWVVVVI